jgi:hypothetical protein
VKTEGAVKNDNTETPVILGTQYTCRRQTKQEITTQKTKRMSKAVNRRRTDNVPKGLSEVVNRRTDNVPKGLSEAVNRRTDNVPKGLSEAINRRTDNVPKVIMRSRKSKDRQWPIEKGKLWSTKFYTES